MTSLTAVGMFEAPVVPQSGECHVCGDTEVTSIEVDLFALRVACRACGAERLLLLPLPTVPSHGA